MCINENMTLILRALINDLDSETYADERLEQLIAIAARFVAQDTGSISYTINISSPDISPDPFGQNDNIFVNLTVLKAACMVDHGNLRMKAAIAGLSAVAGPTNLSVGGSNFTAYKDIIGLGPCALYQKMLQDYVLGSGLVCRGILSPFVSNVFDPETFNRYNSEEYR